MTYDTFNDPHVYLLSIQALARRLADRIAVLDRGRDIHPSGDGRLPGGLGV